MVGEKQCRETCEYGTQPHPRRKEAYDFCDIAVFQELRIEELRIEELRIEELSFLAYYTLLKLYTIIRL